MKHSQEETGQMTETARTAAGEVASSAKDQARSLVGEAREEAGHVTDDVRSRIREETQNQTQRASENLRQWSQDLAEMADQGKEESPVRDVVHQVAQSGRGAADFLEDRGFDGLMEEAKGFARRKPTAFLIGAAVAGFAVGRVIKASSAVSEQAGSGGGPAELDAAPSNEQERAPMPRQGTSNAGETIHPSVASERLGRAGEGGG